MDNGLSLCVRGSGLLDLMGTRWPKQLGPMLVRLHRSRILLAILLSLVLPSCFLLIRTDGDDFTIVGFLSTDCGSGIVEGDRGTYGLRWSGVPSEEIPPLGSSVTLRVRHVGGNSPCSTLGMVEVLEVLDVAAVP